MKLDVTAFEADLYVDKTAASSTGTNAGIVFRMTDGSGNHVGTSSVPAASLSATAETEIGSDSVSRFVVKEGETETFTLTVTFDPEVQGFYAVEIFGVNYKVQNTGAATVSTQKALPVEDFESDPLSI